MLLDVDVSGNTHKSLRRYCKYECFNNNISFWQCCRHSFFHTTAFAGPLDRTSIAIFMENSAAIFIDLNGDQAVSDTDIAFVYRNKLIAKFDEDYSTGDLNGDGEITALDLHKAIYDQLRVSFGKVVDDDAPVGLGDVVKVLEGVVDDTPDVDVNADGVVDIQDVAAANLLVGTQVSHRDLDKYAWELYEYLMAIDEHGESAFLTGGPGNNAPLGHVVGISNTWPPYTPAWSPANHVTSISNSYPEGHNESVSSSWPTNHDQGVSRSWEYDDHGFGESENRDHSSVIRNYLKTVNR